MAEAQSDTRLNQKFLKKPQWLFLNKQVRDSEGHRVWIQELALPGGSRFYFPDAPVDTEAKEIWQELSSTEKSQFQIKRRNVLQKLSSILDSTEVAWGVGSLAKEYLLNVVSRYRPEGRPAEAILRQAIRDGVLSHEHDGGMSARATTMIQNMLSVVDRELWSHAALVAKSNEVGMTVIADVGMGALFLDRGIYGSAGLGLTFAYHHIDEGVVFELFTDLQSGKRGLPVVAQAAVCVKCLLHIASQDPKEPELSQFGRALYPPGPLAILDTGHLVETGFSQGLGFPPLDTVFGMENRMLRTTWLRLATSSIDTGQNFRADSQLLSTPAAGVRATMQAISNLAWKGVASCLRLARTLIGGDPFR